MSEQILTLLKRKLDDLATDGSVDAETLRNVLKEELQFYILNFIYHHNEYGKWVMYGGSALRIIHKLNRMSVDLDFEISHEVTEKFLEDFKKEIEEHFTNTYGTDNNFLTIKITHGRGLLLRFHVGEDLTPGNPSNQVHVKIDLNHFVAPKSVTERRPINRDQLSFVILTYNMGALMASKLAAIFLRGTRGIGEAVYEEKGRDIYDLLWYMEKRIVPDFDYLVAKHIDAKDPRVLFDKLTIQMNKVSDENLKQDLEPLFVNRSAILNWLMYWRESYFRLLQEYKIRTIKELERITVSQDIRSDIFSFVYWYKTEEGGMSVRVVYTVVYEWIKFQKLLGVDIDESILPLTDFKFDEEPSDQLRQFIALFNQKNESYFKKTNRIMLGDSIVTKLIRTTTEKLNSNEQIVLNNSALRSCELDDLLK